MNAQHLMNPLRRERGVTLVELMVAIAINLVLVLAATLLYLNTRSTQRAVDEKSAVSETGQFALELLGRDITLAAFYPMAASEPEVAGAPTLSAVPVTYDIAAERLVNGGQLKPAYRRGLMGCDGQAFSAKDHVCDAAAADFDSLVVAYFTSDALGLTAGLRADCTRADVANDGKVAPNASRVGVMPQSEADKKAGKAPSARTESGLQPASPLLVINHYFLRPIELLTEGGRTVQTNALACRGNGRQVGGTMVAADLITGVEQMEITYGVRAPDLGFAGMTPHRYLTATQVSGLKDMSIGDLTLDAWQQVLTVKVCLMVRSTESTAPRNAKGEVVPVNDCSGEPMALADGGLVQRFERVFSLKNRQGVSPVIRVGG